MPGSPVRIFYLAEGALDHSVAAHLAPLAPEVHVFSPAALAGDAPLPDDAIVLWQPASPAEALAAALPRLRELLPDQPLIVLVGPEAEALAAEALDHGVTDYVLTTPVQLLRLPQLVARTAEGYRQLAARKAAEESLRTAEAHYRMLVENLPMAISTTALDTPSATPYMSPQIAGLLGFTPEEWLQKPNLWLQQTHPEDAARVIEAAAAAGPRGVMQAEIRMIHRDGHPIWIQYNQQIITKDGRRLLLATISDIQDRKAAQLALEQLNQTLEERIAERTARLKQALDDLQASERHLRERSAELSQANVALAQAARLKDEFLSNMSHELRTPLNAILGRAEMLTEQIFGPLNERQLQSVRSIEESGRHLLELINDILDLSKIAAEKLQLELSEVDLPELCEAALRMVATTAAQKCLSLSSSVDPMVGSITGDARRIRQILVNLLGNAVKFTPEGGQVGLEVRGDLLAGEVQLAVWDTGIGIAAEHQDRLFQPFVQIDSSLSRQYVGTGLGLALVARLTALHGGRVTLESSPGQGSRFTVVLPWAWATRLVSAVEHYS